MNLYREFGFQNLVKNGCGITCFAIQSYKNKEGLSIIEAEKNKYSINAVENSFRILELIVQKQGEISALDLHNQTGIPKPTLHKLLQTLKGLGYIDQNPLTNQYFTTLKPLQLGYYCLNHRQFLSTFYPYVLMYLRRFQCAISLTAFSGYDPVTIYSAVGGNNIVVDENSVMGKTAPLYASASGRLLLSSKEDAAVRQVLDTIPLTPFTNRTPFEVEDIVQSLKIVREKGYCRLDGEMYLGFSVYAFPLYDHTNVMVGSLELVLQEQDADQIMTENVIRSVMTTLNKVRLQND